MIGDGARKFGKEGFAFDGTIEDQTEFDGLLFSAERLPEGLVLEFGGKILPCEFNRRFRVIISLDWREGFFEVFDRRD